MEAIRAFPAVNKITSFLTSTTSNTLRHVRSFTGSFNYRTRLISAGMPPPQPQEVPRDAFDIESAGDAVAGSFDDHTSLISAGVPPSPPQEAPRDPFDIESAGDPVVPADEEEEEEESKRVSKSVQPVCLFVASASLMMFVNLPKPADAADGHGAVLYGANLAFICLSVFTSLGLSMYSVKTRAGEPGVPAVQKKVMVAAVAFLLVSFVLRMLMTATL